MHETRFTIRSTQLDSFGHLNNAAYLEIYEWARWEWAELHGSNAREAVEHGGVGPAILKIEVDFRKEVRIHEQVRVRTWFHAIEGIRGVVRQQMLLSDDRVASEIRVVFVMFDLKKRRAMPLTQQMKDAYAADAPAREKAALMRSGTGRPTPVAPAG